VSWRLGIDPGFDRRVKLKMANEQTRILMLITCPHFAAMPVLRQLAHLSEKA
jgi:hypothetical protein